MFKSKAGKAAVVFLNHPGRLRFPSGRGAAAVIQHTGSEISGSTPGRRRGEGTDAERLPRPELCADAHCSLNHFCSSLCLLKGQGQRQPADGPGVLAVVQLEKGT